MQPICGKTVYVLTGVVFSICLTFSSFSFGEKSEDFESQVFKLVKKHRLKADSLGLITADEDGEILLQHNTDKLFIPASLIKLFTASTLLDLLSPALQFQTQFASLSKPKDGVLDGDLYFIGGGDPSFVSESLWMLVNDLYRTGVRTIEGHLIGDDHFFDKKNKGPRLEQISHRSYSALTGALSFNWNVVGIYVRPGDSLKSKARVHIDPSARYFSEVRNSAVTSGKSKKLQVTKGGSPRSLVITGRIPLDGKEKLFYRSVSNPTLWATANALDFLKQRGIEVKGQVQTGKALGTEALAVHKGKSLVEKYPFDDEVLQQFYGGDVGETSGTFKIKWDVKAG